MHIKVDWENNTKALVNIVADAKDLAEIKRRSVEKLKSTVKVSGFRDGHVPTEVAEKNIPDSQLQTEFMDTALNIMYTQAIQTETLKPVSSPQVTIKKFVPYTELEVEMTVESIGKIELPDYKKIKVDKPEAKVTEADVTSVLKNLAERAAERKDVDRASKNGDSVVIDFAGKNKAGEPIQNASGTDYPLVIGSNTFIPGFEPQLIGLKAGENKEFEIKFPKDYGVAELQNQPVLFTVTIKKVQEVLSPKIDDAFAGTVGPFKTLDELKADIKKQLGLERQQEAQRQYENDLLRAIAAKTKMSIPQQLVDNQIDRMEQEEKQNLVYRGQTWEEHLKAEGLTAEQHREKNRPTAEEQIKIGLTLSEIAEQEKLDVTPDELNVRIAELKKQYTDEKMQAELDKPENRRDLASRILSEKTIALLTKN